MSEREPLLIEWTERAVADMHGIADYLLEKGIALGDVEEYVKRIYKAPVPLATLPGAGKPGRMPTTREWLVKDTPYALIYDVKKRSLRILRVMHGNRDFPEQ